MNIGIILFWGVIVFMMIVGFFISHDIKKGAKKELRKIVESTGARHVHIRNNGHGRDVLRYKVDYTDARGQQQTRTVTRDIGFMGTPKGDFYWDNPLTPRTAPTPLPSPSKEQLVSEMSAEIKRLQAELAAATVDGANGGHYG